ncbi:MAG: hypothetical protein E7269_06690 [Lachnospiraceae bacterium]|nr:hypothetical protein [Lachnospiraceae bacterium]
MDTKTQDKVSIYIFLVGLIFLVMKLTIPMDFGYPTYNSNGSVIPATQLYTLNTHYGATATYLGMTYGELGEEMRAYVDSGKLTMDGVRWDTRMDLFNDFIGLALMAYACFRLKKRRGTFFTLGYVSAVAAIVMKAVICLAPYVLSGERLMWVAFFIGIANFFMKVSVSYFFVAGLCQCLDRVNYRQDRRILLLVWFLMFVVQAIVGITTWVLVGGVTMAYNIILFFLTAWFVWKVVQMSEFAVRNEVAQQSLLEIYHNSDRYIRKMNYKEQKRLRKAANAEIRERRRKIEEAKRR